MKNPPMLPEPAHPRRSRRFVAAVVVFVAASAIIGPVSGPISRAQARDVKRESTLKAAYLYNFIQFVEWPASPAAQDFTICFLEKGGVYQELSAALPDKRLGNRRVLARQLARKQALTGCDVLYIDAEQLAASGTTLDMHRPAVLTVSDAEGFLKSGGIIELFAQGNRLRFRISLENARNSQLRIGSGLLNLASEVVMGR